MCTGPAPFVAYSSLRYLEYSNVTHHAITRSRLTDTALTSGRRKLISKLFHCTAKGHAKYLDLAYLSDKLMDFPTDLAAKSLFFEETAVLAGNSTKSARWGLLIDKPAGRRAMRQRRLCKSATITVSK